MPKPETSRKLEASSLVSENVPSSPCINVCKVDDGVCTACGRTVEQIAGWGSMTEEERKQIMNEL